MKKNTFKLASLFLCGWMSLSLMSFACRQDTTTEASAELKTEIEEIEAEAAEIEQSEKEIQDATAKVDSLLNEIK